VEQDEGRPIAGGLAGKRHAPGPGELAQHLKRLRPHASYTVTRGWKPL
jgi:hypothetical protein